MENKTNFAKYEEGRIAYGLENPRPNTLMINYGGRKIKSHLKLGNIVVCTSRRFNWFQRKMWKLFFGFDVEDV